MRYELGEEFIVEAPVKITGVKEIELVHKTIRHYEFRGMMAGGVEIIGSIWEDVKKEAECPLRRF